MHKVKLRVFILNRLHLRKLALKRLGVGMRQTVSNVRTFKNIGQSQLIELQKTQLRKRTEAKMMWGVRAYNEWHTVKLCSKDIMT